MFVRRRFCFTWLASRLERRLGDNDEAHDFSGEGLESINNGCPARVGEGSNLYKNMSRGENDKGHQRCISGFMISPFLQ